MDDIYACGPPAVVFPAVIHFAAAIRAALGLELQVAKSSCYSSGWDLDACPWRARAGIPIGMEQVSVPWREGRERLQTAHGILVGGVPLGCPLFVDHTLRCEVDTIESYIRDTVTELQGESPHAVWAALYYCCASRFDYWLRHVPPRATRPHAERVDRVVRWAVEELGYVGMVGDRITWARVLLPARMRGLGLRSRAVLAPAAYAACFVESAERFLSTRSVRGFFDMLMPLFGPGAFDGAYPRAARFSRILSAHGVGALRRHQLPSVLAFQMAWFELQQEMVGSTVTGPLDVTEGAAGDGRSSTAGLQRLITAQREQRMRDQLHHEIMQLPRHDTRREAWLACDSFSSAWIGSWPTERDALSPQEFPEVLATYLGRESPLVRRHVGRMIPCSQMRARAGGRVCDEFGHQLGMAQLTDRAHGVCHDGIAATITDDILRAGVEGDAEPRALFAGVLPPHRLDEERERDGQRGGGRRFRIIPDARLHVRLHEARTDRSQAGQRWGGTTSQQGPRQRYATDQIFDMKTIHGGGPDYRSARASGTDGQSGAVAHRAERVHRDYEAAARGLDALPDVQAFNAGRTDAVSAQLQLYGRVRALVVGQYGEMSIDLHELLDVAAEAAARTSWRFLGARSQGEATGYYRASMRRAWGVAAVREFARHRVGRVRFIGAPPRPGAQTRRAQAQGLHEEWAMRSSAAFHAHASRLGGFALSARRGAPVRRA